MKNFDGVVGKNSENDKSREFEDVKFNFLWKKDRFVIFRDCDKLFF